MKKTLLLTLFGLFTTIVNAQIVTGEQPYSMNVASKMQKLAPIVLSAPDVALIAKEDAVNNAHPGPVRYAYPTNVNYTLDNSGLWQTLEDGSRIWRLKVKLPGALSTNTYYDKFWLPEGAKFFVYSENTKQCIGAVTSEYIGGSQKEPVAFATALIYGEDAVFEYYQPASVKDTAVISISRIDYGYRYVNNPYADTLQNTKASGSCQVNVNCSEGDNWQIEKNAVTRISIPLTSGTGWCSGALVNNTNNNRTPYVLTANHCLAGLDAINNNNAGQWMFYWNYEYSNCAGGTQIAYKTTTGATVTANHIDSDFALLQLKQDPRNVADITLHYSGWDRSGNAGTGGVGIHHPQGDVKKISTYSMTPINSSCTNPNLFWDVQFISTAHGYSVMENGSSGSPLLNNNHRIIGQLLGPGNTVTCPPYQCDNPSLQQVAYGKFDVSWTGNGETDNRRRLQSWLDPAGTSPQTLDGITYYSVIGADIVGCNSSGTFAVSQATLPSYNWTVTSPLYIMSGQGTSNITVGASGISAPTTATITLNGSFSKQVLCGLPTITGINGPTYVSPNTPVTYTTVPYFSPSIGECQWYVDDYPTYDSMGGSVTLSFTSGLHVLTCQPWSCYMGAMSPGLTIYAVYSYSVVSGAGRQITVTPSADDTENGGAVPLPAYTGTIKYTLVDESTGSVAAGGQLPATGGTLDFARFPEGAYTFRINSIDGSIFETHSIVL